MPHQPEQERAVPARHVALALHAHLGGLALDRVETQLAQDREVRRAVVLADPRAVLVEHHVEDPVQAVLDLPVRAGQPVRLGRRQRPARKVAHRLDGRLLAGHLALPLDLHHAPQMGPGVLLLEPLDVLRAARRARLDPPVVLLQGAVRVDPRVRRQMLPEPLQILVQLPLVALRRDQVVGAARDDRRRGGALAVQRVQGHHRTVQRQHVQHLPHRGNLVRLAVHAALRQHRAVARGPHVDHVQGGLPVRPVVRAARRLAVHRVHVAVRLARHERPHEPREPLLERVRVQHPEQARERVVARRPVLVGQPLAQKLQLRPREVRHVDARLRTAQRRGERRVQQLRQGVALGVARARVLEFLHHRQKAVHGSCSHPKGCPMLTSLRK